MCKDFFFQLKNSNHVKFFWGNILKAFFLKEVNAYISLYILERFLENCEKTTFP